MQIKATKPKKPIKESLWKALLFSFLIMLAFAVGQGLYIYYAGGFSRILIFLNLASGILATYMFLLYYKKHIVLPIIWIVVFLILLNQIATFISEAYYLSKDIDWMSFSETVKQMFYALFDKSKFSTFLDYDAWHNAITQDLKTSLAYAAFGIALCIVSMIVAYVQAKKQQEMYFVAKPITEEKKEEPKVVEAKAEAIKDLKQDKYKEILTELSLVVKDYLETKDKETFQYNMRKFRSSVYEKLTDEQKQELKDYAKGFENDQDKNIAKASMLILTKF